MWKFKKQATVSTTEAKFEFLCEAAAENCWIKNILFDLMLRLIK